MFTQKFSVEYPHTSAAFMQMVRRDKSSRSHDNRSVIKAELLKQAPAQADIEALFAVAWTEAKQSRSAFAVSTGDAFAYLGVSDEVRALIGGVWAKGFQQWIPAGQLEFLQLLITSEELHRDLVLEFLPNAVASLTLAPLDFWGWVVASKQGKDAYPHRMSAILQKYAEAKPREALQLVALFLPQASDDATARLIALLVHWVRQFGSEKDEKSALESFEATLASGSAKHCAILLESWAFSAAAPTLDGIYAGNLKRKLVRGTTEAKAWCFLLQQVVFSSPDKLPWAVMELRDLATTALTLEQKNLVVTAVLHGWLTAEPSSQVPRAEWEALIRQLSPFNTDDTAIWNHLSYFLVDAFEKDAVAAVHLVAMVAETSGFSWSKVMSENRDEFGWWCQTLRDGGHAQSVVAALCFSNSRGARQVGLHIVRNCGTAAFNPAALSGATSEQIERLLLEAVVKLDEYDFIGGLHLTFAERIDQIGGTLAEWFYDETLTQALNTNKYRQVILDGGVAANSKLRKAVEEAMRRIDVSVKASQSPALRMLIPGQARAEVLSMRRFGRAVAKGIKKYSVLSQFCSEVPLLYGKSWRMTDPSGAVGEATTLSKIETSMEMPRLEFMAPEAMRHRRLLAVKRIVELDQGIDQEP